MSWTDPALAAVEGDADPERLAAAECARANKCIALLDEIADMAMELARAQQRKALAQLEAEPQASPDTGAGRERDAATGFINAARAVRVTLLLQTKLQAGLNARRIELASERKHRAFAAAIERAQEGAYEDEDEDDDARGSDALADIVADVIETEAGDRPDVERLAGRGRDLVQLGRQAAGFDEAPIRDVVARVCQALDIPVHWPNWETEDWAVAEADDGVPGSPFVKADGDEAAERNGYGGHGGPGPEPPATGPP